MAIRRHLGLLIIIVAAVLLELISTAQYYYMRRMLASELEERAETELTLKAVITKRLVENAERTLKSHIMEVKNNLAQPDSMASILAWTIKYEPNLTGCGIAFRPGYYPQRERLFEPYALRTDSGIAKLQIASESFDYTRDGFYRDIMRIKADSWVGPYDDVYLKKKLVSYALPIYDNQRDTIAVLGVDIDVTLLGDTLNASHLYPSSFNLLLTEDGHFIAGTDGAKMDSRTERVVGLINDSTQQRRQSRNGRTSIIEFYDQERHDDAYIISANFRGQPHWQLAIVCYDDEVYGPLSQMRQFMLLMMVAGFSILGFIVWRFFGSERRLRLSQLAQERIGSELRVAHNIQASMLPEKYPPFPERDDLDIYGTLIPAREVGGDLFDFFIRDEKLFFCIGDVSGKGVPAAMVMAVTHHLFRAASTHESNPAKIMQSLNETLAQGNESNMFVTMFVGVLDLPSGRLRFCNAGHDHPILLGSADSPLSVQANANLPLGVFGDFKYTTEQTELTPGSMLFLYTDGLTEAMNAHHEQFRLQRVLTLLANDCPPTTAAHELLPKVEQAVRQFVGNAEQSDDLTLLAIGYNPPQKAYIIDETLTVTNDIQCVLDVNQAVNAVSERIGLPAALSKELKLAVEEAVVNVINYAYPQGTKGDITLRITYDGHQLRYVITDAGVAFDPTAATDADTTLSVEDRPIGGLGILLVKKLMDTINYERVDNQNILTLSKNITT